MHKVIADPPAIVVQAECQIEAVSKAAKELRADYVAAVRCREEGNRHGLNIGKRIIMACFDTDLVAQINRLNNTKEKQESGGAPIKAHAWAAKEIARITGYSEDHLLRCARTYIAAVNKTAGKPVLLYDRGVLRQMPENPLPEPKDLLHCIRFSVPRIDDLPEEGAQKEEDPQVDVKEWALTAAAAAYRKICDDKRISLKSNKAARTALIRAFNTYLEDVHFSLVDELASRKD
jgi:hypothetical protein